MRGRMREISIGDEQCGWRLIEKLEDGSRQDDVFEVMHIDCGFTTTRTRNWWMYPRFTSCLKCKRYPVGHTWKNRVIVDNMHRDGKTGDLVYLAKCNPCQDIAIVRSNTIKSEYSCQKCQGNGYWEHRWFLSFQALEARYRLGASARDLDYELSQKEFLSLVTRRCTYCGAHPRNSPQKHIPETKLNGIDRKDSKLGYFAENCVTCCSTCNRAKSDMDYEDWIEYLDALGKFRYGLES